MDMDIKQVLSQVRYLHNLQTSKLVSHVKYLQNLKSEIAISSLPQTNSSNSQAQKLYNDFIRKVNTYDK